MLGRLSGISIQSRIYSDRLQRNQGQNTKISFGENNRFEDMSLLVNVKPVTGNIDLLDEGLYINLKALKDKAIELNDPQLISSINHSVLTLIGHNPKYFPVILKKDENGKFHPIKPNPGARLLFSDEDRIARQFKVYTDDRMFINIRFLCIATELLQGSKSIYATVSSGNSEYANKVMKEEPVLPKLNRLINTIAETTDTNPEILIRTDDFVKSSR